MTGKIDRVVMWQALDWPSTEHLSLRADGSTVVADGLVVGYLDDMPIRVAYRLDADAAWTTRRLRVAMYGRPELTIESNGAGEWTSGGAALPDLAGCIDVDFAVTPFTNTLPIRRLPWSAGQARDLRIAYVDLDLSVRPATQRYTCLATTDTGSRFRYESDGFRAELEVDSDGIVIDYAGYWRRIGEAS